MNSETIINDDEIRAGLQADLGVQLAGNFESNLTKYSYLGRGAEAFLRFIANPDYKGFTGEMVLLDMMAGDLARLGSGPLNLFDLGPGNGLKAAKILEIFLGGLQSEEEINYTALDMSVEMLEIARGNLGRFEAGRASEVVCSAALNFVRADFSQAGNVRDVFSAGQNVNIANNLVMILGNTIANEPDMYAFIRMIRESIPAGGTGRNFLLAGIEVFDGDAEAIRREYDTDENAEFSVLPLEFGNMSAGHKDFLVSFNQVRRRIEEWSILADGGRVLLSSTLKPTFDEWNEMIEESGVKLVSQKRFQNQVLTLVELIP